MNKFDRHALAVWSGNVMHSLGWMMVLGLTGTFTILLFSHYAPPQAPYVPFLALAVCELGVIHWQHFLKHNAKNLPQLLVAGVMLALSLLAIALCTGLELTSMFVLGGNIDLFLPALRTTALIGLVLVTIFNVLAFCLISVSHPETLRRLSRIAATPITMTVEETEHSLIRSGSSTPQLVQRTQRIEPVSEPQDEPILEEMVHCEQQNEPQETGKLGDVVQQFIDAERTKGHEPTIAEIMNETGCSKGTASKYKNRGEPRASTQLSIVQ